MKMGGYAGRILRVDLTKGVIEKEPLPKDLVEKFMGAEGISFRLAYELIPPKMNLKEIFFLSLEKFLYKN